MIGKVAYVRVAIDCLVREGFASESRGARGARLVASIHPFRDGDPVPTPSLDGFANPVPTRPNRNRLTKPNPRPRPTSSRPSPVPAPTPSPPAFFPTGEADGRDGVSERPLLGDALYPVLLAEAGKNGHVTGEEFSATYALHRLVERSQETGAS